LPAPHRKSFRLYGTEVTKSTDFMGWTRITGTFSIATVFDRKQFSKHPPQLIDLISANKAERTIGFLPAAYQSIQLMLLGERKH
jgi:hypothetical protein